MDPRRFLSVARPLLAEGEPEQVRTAVSRMYYAVYNVAEASLLACGVTVDTGHGGHQQVQRALRASRLDALVHVAAQLRQLQELRVRADYRMRDPYPENRAVAIDWLTRTERMIAALDSAAADPATRARIARALGSDAHE